MSKTNHKIEDDIKEACEQEETFIESELKAKATASLQKEIEEELEEEDPQEKILGHYIQEKYK